MTLHRLPAPPPAQAADHVGFPAVIKPIHGAASLGVLRVDSKASLREAYDKVGGRGHSTHSTAQRSTAYGRLHLHSPLFFAAEQGACNNGSPHVRLPAPGVQRAGVDHH